MAHRRGAGHDQRRQVERRHQPGARRAGAALGERQAEVQEHRRQEQHRERVDPEQQPVEAGERAGVGDRVDQEEQRAHGVEVQRRAVGRPAQQHHRAHHQAEEAGEREVVESAHVAPREWLHDEVQHAPFALAQQRVGAALPGAVRREQALQPARAQRLLAVDGHEHVAFPHPRVISRSPGSNAGGDQPLRRLAPEGAVVHEREARLQDEVGDARPGEGQAQLRPPTCSSGGGHSCRAWHSSHDSVSIQIKAIHVPGCECAGGRVSSSRTRRSFRFPNLESSPPNQEPKNWSALPRKKIEALSSPPGNDRLSCPFLRSGPRCLPRPELAGPEPRARPGSRPGTPRRTCCERQAAAPSRRG